ncbi:MAG: putative transposase [Flavobacteriales bacterium]|jgi:putative transposase
MARPPRINLPNVPQHIVQVGHNNMPCFFDDADYAFYLESLKIAADQYQVDVHAYVLLPKAIQLVATPRIATAIPSMMQSVGRRYVQYINHRYQRSGTLWGGRYKSSLIDSSSYLISCYRYVELRPMYLNLVDGPEAYQWSSYHHHALGKTSHLIKDHRLYSELGDTQAERANKYSESFLYAFDQRLMKYIAETISVGQILGGDKFKTKIEEVSQVRLRPKKRGRPKKVVVEVAEKLEETVNSESTNLESQTSNLKPQTSNLKPQTSNLKPQTSNLES